MQVGTSVALRSSAACGAAGGDGRDAAGVDARVVVEVDVLNTVVSRALKVLSTALLAMALAKAAVTQRCTVELIAVLAFCVGPARTSSGCRLPHGADG